MTEPRQTEDQDRHTGAEPDRPSSTGMPRWVKSFGIALAVVVLLLAVLFLVGGGNHGPSRHRARASVVENAAQLEYCATVCHDHPAHLHGDAQYPCSCRWRRPE